MFIFLCQWFFCGEVVTKVYFYAPKYLGTARHFAGRMHLYILPSSIKKMSANDRNRSTIRAAMLIMGILMILLFVGLGAYILLTPAFAKVISPQYRPVFGGMLILYGLYRSWRIYTDYV
jgi:hypothetical protein